MFWKLGFNNQKAPLEALLEREDVKLEEVLDQDDFLQEAKGGNDKLIQLYAPPNCLLSARVVPRSLTQPEIVRKLLQFTTETVNGDDGDDKRRFKSARRPVQSFLGSGQVPILGLRVTGRGHSAHRRRSGRDQGTPQDAFRLPRAPSIAMSPTPIRFTHDLYYLTTIFQLNHTLSSVVGKKL